MDKQKEGGDFGKLLLDLQKYLFSFFNEQELGLVRSTCKYLQKIIDTYSAKFILRVQPSADNKKTVRNLLNFYF